MMRRHTVLHVSEFIKGGVATYLNSLIREQLADPEFDDVRIIAAREHRRFLPDVPNDRIILFDYPQRSITGLRSLNRVLSETLSDFCPSVIQLTSSFPGAIGRLNSAVRRLRRLRGDGQRTPVVYCAQGWSFLMDTGVAKRFAYETAERILARWTDRIICISEHERRGAVEIGIPAEKCDLVYNALPAAPPEPSAVDVPAAVAEARSRGDRVLLFVGRFDRQKGLDLLSGIFDGDSRRGDILLAAGSTAVNSEPVRFGSRMFDVGWSSPGQIESLLAISDALMVPSRWEGFGLVAAEAMRAGRAVICSSRGGLPEVVEHGVTGIVLSSLQPSEIASALNELSSQRLREMGEAGRKRFHRLFTIDQLHQATKRVYCTAAEELCTAPWKF
ncbi:MAG: glycosyltransferase family 4 protein [Planctomycetaceae bacterium]|nr:glycosyltransferase family 4 protein [Planctomycetaceae bacterium]